MRVRREVLTVTAISAGRRVDTEDEKTVTGALDLRSALPKASTKHRASSSPRPIRRAVLFLIDKAESSPVRTRPVGASFCRHVNNTLHARSRATAFP